MAKRGEEKKRMVGQVARSGNHTVRSYQVGAMPLLRRVFDRMALVDVLRQHLPKETSRMRVPTAETLQILVANILIARQPIYGVGEWATGYGADLFGLSASQLVLLQDDRIGRCLDRLFRTDVTALVMDIVRHVVKEFDLSLEELHNDSTTVSFHGDYDDARDPGKVLGFPTIALTWGHSKDHRPDLKQLLYILTVTDDGGVPIYFTTASGNTADDQTHVETWDLLRQLVGHAEFLYVADCKLATSSNMQHIDKRGGRFITILPRTRKENQNFHERARREAASIPWKLIDQRTDKDGETVDTISVVDEEQWSAENFRLLWFHGTRKAAMDSHARIERIERTSKALEELRDKLWSPKTRYRERRKVETAVQEILANSQVESLIRVTIREVEKDSYRQERRGRPGKDTKYVKTVTLRFDISWELDSDAVEQDKGGDGIFPLVTNDLDRMPLEVYNAYKRQPLIEKRFSQFKNDFAVAPIFLKSVTRIQSLLCVYFFALMAQTLLERELRLAMERDKVNHLPLYPEQRKCAKPTTSRLMDVFGGVQRHQVTVDGERIDTVTQLSQAQRQVLKLLGMRIRDYGCKEI